MGALSSALLLFGIVLLYGVAGSRGPVGPHPAGMHFVRPRGVPRGEPPQLPGGRGHRARPLWRRLQDRRVSLPDLDAGRLPGGADPGDGISRGRIEGRRVHRPAGPRDAGVRALRLAGRAGAHVHGSRHDPLWKPGGAQAEQREATDRPFRAYPMPGSSSLRWHRRPGADARSGRSISTCSPT